MLFSLREVENYCAISIRSHEAVKCTVKHRIGEILDIELNMENIAKSDYSNGAGAAATDNKLENKQYEADEGHKSSDLSEKKCNMSSEDSNQKGQIISIISEKQVSSVINKKGQHKAYKRRRVKVKRSKSQGYKQDSNEFTIALKGNLGSDNGSSDEDIVKLKERVRLKGRSNRKVMMVDWDKTPFVFSVRGKGRGEGRVKAHILVRCKSIATIQEEEEADSILAETNKGR